MGLGKATGIRIPKNSGAVLLAGTDTTVYTPASGRVFYVESIIVTAKSGYAAEVEIFDGASANNVRPVVPIGVRAGDTIALGENELRGIPEFHSGVVAKADTSGVVWIQVIGYEV